ncbi:MAG: restriction endonuclease subunit S [Alkalispirochaeta sp.]
MNGWPMVPLGEVCELINGRAFKPSDWQDEGLPIVRIQNLNDAAKPFNHFGGPYSVRHFIDDGAILLSWSGTPGTSFGCFRWQGGPALLNQHIFKVLVDDSKIDSDFFIYAVNSRLDEMINQSHGGVGLRHITKAKLVGITLPCPPLEEQRRIVARIKECMVRIDEIEELRGDALREYVAMRTALLGAIIEPDGWSSMKVGDLVTTSRNGKSISTSNEGATGFVLGLSAVRGVNLDTNARKPIVLPSDILAKYPVRRGDVFVSRSNTQELVGLASVATQDIDNCIYPDLLIKLSPDPQVIYPRFLAYALRIPSARAQIRERASGTSQSMVKISGARLKEVAIPVPLLEMQSALIKKLDQVHDRATDLFVDLNSPEITHLRESILRKAFAGEL